ncbi:MULTISPECIES: CaiF/GrlA family transcriptional regulator [Edwardsiella]
MHSGNTIANVLSPSDNGKYHSELECWIPVSLIQYCRFPLYLIVALWGQQQQRWIDRNDISNAFKISARRASSVLFYLRNNRLISTRTKEHVYRNGYVRRIDYFIDSVDLQSFFPRPAAERMNEAKKKKKKLPLHRINYSLVNKLTWQDVFTLRKSIREDI